MCRPAWLLLLVPGLCTALQSSPQLESQPQEVVQDVKADQAASADQLLQETSMAAVKKLEKFTESVTHGVNDAMKGARKQMRQAVRKKVSKAATGIKDTVKRQVAVAKIKRKHLTHRLFHTADATEEDLMKVTTPSPEERLEAQHKERMEEIVRQHEQKVQTFHKVTDLVVDGVTGAVNAMQNATKLMTVGAAKGLQAASDKLTQDFTQLVRDGIQQEVSRAVEAEVQALPTAGS